MLRGKQMHKKMSSEEGQTIKRKTLQIAPKGKQKYAKILQSTEWVIKQYYSNVG